VPLALITGASTGIGRATALRLAGSGWTVLAGVRNDAAAQELREAALAGTGSQNGDGGGAGGARVQPITLDVTDAAQIAAAARAVEEAGGRRSRRA